MTTTRARFKLNLIWRATLLQIGLLVIAGLLLFSALLRDQVSLLRLALSAGGITLAILGAVLSGVYIEHVARRSFRLKYGVSVDEVGEVLLARECGADDPQRVAEIEARLQQTGWRLEPTNKESAR